jgi:hypothetical protein
VSIPSETLNRGDTLGPWHFDVDMDCTGWTPRVVVKAQAGWADALDAAALFSATTASGLTVVDAAAGLIDMTIAASVTTTWAPGTYVGELQLSSGTTVHTVEWDTTTHETKFVLTVTADVARTSTP